MVITKFVYRHSWKTNILSISFTFLASTNLKKYITMRADKKNIIKIFLITLSVIFYIFSFHYKDFIISGSQIDFETFVFNNIQLFKVNLSVSIKNYGLLKDANYPLFYIFHAYLNPFSHNEYSYLLSTFVIGLFTFLIFSFCLRKLDFKIIDSLLLSSIILFLPFFTGRAFWGTSANLGWFFLSISFLFFLELKKKIFLDFRISDLINIFGLCFFTAVALYVRVSFIFFAAFIVCYFFLYDNSLERKKYILIFFSLFSLPGFFLIYSWGGIYDHANSDIIYLHHSYKNILKNIPILLSFFFFYLWPILILEIKDLGTNKFIRKYLKSFIFISIIFFILNFTDYLSYLSINNYGGGALLKFGYLIKDKYNVLFLCTASVGFSIIYNLIKNNFKTNFILVLFIFIIYGFPQHLFQDYLEPLIIFLFFTGILSSSLIKYLKENSLIISTIYYIYFFLFNIASLFVRSNLSLVNNSWVW